MESPDLEAITETLKKSGEEAPIAPGAKVAKGKSRASPKAPREVHGEASSSGSASSSSKPGISHAAFDMWTVLHRQTKSKMPWETAAFANPFQQEAQVGSTSDWFSGSSQCSISFSSS